jgi:D-psicose/D-tagatose/L-ribulose 3-epimerase
MKKLGSKTLVGAIYSFWPTDFVDTNKEAAWETSIACLQELSKTAEELDIECALEVLNRNETYILTDCAEAIEYVGKVGSRNINILLDTYHMNIEEDNMYDAIRKAGDLLGHLHVGECNRKLPGMNNSINWPEIGKALRDINYKKAVVMEPFMLKGGQVGHDIRVWRDLSNNATPEQMDQYIKDSLVYLKKCCLG